MVNVMDPMSMGHPVVSPKSVTRRGYLSHVGVTCHQPGNLRTRNTYSYQYEIRAYRTYRRKERFSRTTAPGLSHTPTPQHLCTNSSSSTTENFNAQGTFRSFLIIKRATTTPTDHRGLHLRIRDRPHSATLFSSASR